MNTLTVSRKFQIVIPREVCTALDMVPGKRVHVIVYNGRIQIIPVLSARELRGTMLDVMHVGKRRSAKSGGRPSPRS